jgi:hypothetical protein
MPESYELDDFTFSVIYYKLVWAVADIFMISHECNKETKLNTVACIRVRTIPTERPPLVGEVSANFYG